MFTNLLTNSLIHFQSNNIEAVVSIRLGLLAITITQRMLHWFLTLPNMGKLFVASVKVKNKLKEKNKSHKLFFNALH